MLYTGVQSNYFLYNVIFLRIIPRTWLPLEAAILHCSETFMLALYIIMDVSGKIFWVVFVIIARVLLNQPVSPSNRVCYIYIMLLVIKVSV